MDEETARRWRAGLPPFDGLRISTGVLLPLPVLRRVLGAVVCCLQEGHPGARLLTLHDWHEHDGYVNLPQPTSWEELRARLASDDALYTSRSGDYQVSVATFPEDRSFYFRFHLLDEDEDADHYPGRWGWFDVSTSEPLMARLLDAAAAEGADNLVTEPAKAYFDRWASS